MTTRWSAEDVALHYARLGRSMPDTTPPVPEHSFLAQVLRLARDLGYLAYHTHRSDRSEAGFPDCVLVRPATTSSTGRLICAELKSATGKLTQAQTIWLDVLKRSIPSVEVYVWRPADLPQIATILAQKD